MRKLLNQSIVTLEAILGATLKFTAAAAEGSDTAILDLVQ